MPSPLRLAAIVPPLIVALDVSVAVAIPIDPGVPPGDVSTAPRELPLTYAFTTSWDGRAWAEDEKAAARQALDYLGGFFTAEIVFVETAVAAEAASAPPPAFTMRWAGADLFRDWGMFEGESWDYSTALAFAVKPREDDSTPWPQDRYPYNEVYFNDGVRWHFNPLTSPAEGDPAVEGDGEYDFWTVALHETIHMMSVDDHAEHPEEVMYFELGDGEARRRLQPSDLQLLREAGYTVVPAPGAAPLLATAMLALFAAARRRRINARAAGPRADRD